MGRVRDKKLLNSFKRTNAKKVKVTSRWWCDKCDDYESSRCNFSFSIFLFQHTTFRIYTNREHKYNCTSDSFLDSSFQPWWNFLVSKTPLWIAPNSLTIVGLLVNIITSLLLLYHAPDAKTDAPRWTYLSCAVGLFIYQSLDAIGKYWFDS